MSITQCFNPARYALRANADSVRFSALDISACTIFSVGIRRSAIGFVCCIPLGERLRLLVIGYNLLMCYTMTTL